MTPTDRLSGFGTGLATNSAAGERVPRGHCSQYSSRNGSAHASFFRSLATRMRAYRPASCAALTRRFLSIPHTDQFRRMVAIADRSPARYIFELKLAEVPSGPLNSKLVMLRPTIRPASSAIVRAADSESYGYLRRFLSSRLVPARFRSRSMRMVDAWSMALITCLRGRPGGRRVRLKASRSSGRMAHTIPTLIPYSRCLSSNRRT